MRIIAIIPARYASTRFPGKPLAMLGGKTIIERVYQQVAPTVDAAYVATDDERIFQAVEGFGGRAVMTSAEHPSGTDRVAEAARIVGADADIIVNVQGDEPFIQPEQIRTLCSLFDDERTEIATLARPLTSIEDVQNPNKVKVVRSIDGFALYFSRAAIPFVRGEAPENWLPSHEFFCHLGIYAYRSEVLQAVTTLPVSKLEQAERLEQLRWLENGLRIRVGLTEHETIGIDTPEDLQRAEECL